MTSRTASFPPQSFGEVTGLWPGPGALELVPSPLAEGSDPELLPEPFARLPDSGGVATTLLARAPASPGSHLGILVRTDGDAGTDSAVAGDRWFRALGGELDLLAGGAARAVVLPPLWFCKRRRLLFVPPCPACGEPLAECRDDGLRAAAGLGPRDTSPHRYLACPACDGGERPGGFYHPAGEPAGNPRVGDRWALIDGFGARVAGAEGADAAFPCPGCTFSHSCYPAGEGGAAGEARTLLVPVAFYGGEACLVEALPLDYDTAGALFGGREAAEREAAGEVETPAPGPGGAKGFLFADPAEGRRALEALLLKLTAFEQLCAGVERIHRSLGRAHLNLNPATARVALGEGGGAAPELWRSRVAPLGLDGARPADGAERPREFLPPLRFDLSCSHPMVAVCGGAGEWQPARFAVHSVLEDASAGGWVVVGDLLTERLRPEELGPADTFQVVLGQGLGFRTEIQLGASCQGSANGGVSLRSAPVTLDPADQERLASLIAVPQVEVRFSVARRYGVECDLFSLGMLLLRSLLVNGGQGADEVSRRCRFLAGELEGGEDASAAVADRCAADPVFDPGNLLWQPRPGGGAAVPGELWRQVLSMGFAMLAGRAAESVPAPGAAVDGTAVERVRRAVVSLLPRVREALLTWRPPAEGEIRAVLAELIDDPAWLERVLAADGQGGPAVPEEIPGGEGTELPTAAVPTPPAGESPNLDETLILRPEDVAAALGDTPRAAPVPPAAPPGGPPPGLDETVILKRPPGGGLPVAPEAPTSAAAPASPALEETVILRPGEVPGRPGAEPPGGGGSATGGEDLEKTIILRRGKPEGGR